MKITRRDWTISGMQGLVGMKNKSNPKGGISSLSEWSLDPNVTSLGREFKERYDSNFRERVYARTNDLSRRPRQSVSCTNLLTFLFTT